MTPTGRVPLGRTGLSVTELGLGLAPLGGLYTDVSEQDARDAVETGWDLGVRFFDTAPLYGFGRSETRAGAALAGRTEFVLSTKAGRVITSVPDGGGQDFWAGVDPAVAPVFDFSAAGIRRSFEDSLERLGVDRIDVLHLHDPDDHLDQAVRDAYPEMVKLKEEGLVAALGAGANSGAVLTHLIERCDLDVVLLAGRYTLLDRTGEPLLALAAERGVAVIAGGVFNSGLLADPKPGARFDYAQADGELLNRAIALRDLCEAHGVPLRAAAIQYAQRHPAITSVLVGVRSADEVRDAVAMAAHPVPAELWAALA
ncbi:aldo/keto reductase [Hamadaea tsunoensis]|uniref:aldo/keto reductase n=1 Tax=Hamadaea tsunoensis TaxID=53368 RepID=UPI00041D4171|nr:aldo/keto reductase [Hamadaea tsunoensis]